MALTAADLKIRTASQPSADDDENSFATLAELSNLIKFRVDAGVWDLASEEVKVRAAATAYADLMKLTFRRYGDGSQSRDYEFSTQFAAAGFVEQVSWPPMEDLGFARAIKKAQAAQAMFILNGTQVRDMAREGIRMSRGLVGAEMEFTGYRGAVCVEAIELVAHWVELMPRMRRL
jgi:hypothetical protein